MISYDSLIYSIPGCVCEGMISTIRNVHQLCDSNLFPPRSVSTGTAVAKYHIVRTSTWHRRSLQQYYLADLHLVFALAHVRGTDTIYLVPLKVSVHFRPQQTVDQVSTPPSLDLLIYLRLAR